MLERARRVLPEGCVELHARRLEDPLPAGPFDLIFSALAIHHLDGPGKADLFARAAARLVPGGREDRLPHLPSAPDSVDQHERLAGAGPVMVEEHGRNLLAARRTRRTPRTMLAIQPRQRG
jgi:hypothetical protein